MLGAQLVSAHKLAAVAITKVVWAGRWLLGKDGLLAAPLALLLWSYFRYFSGYATFCFIKQSGILKNSTLFLIFKKILIKNNELIINQRSLIA